MARRSRFVQPRGKQRARVKPLHIPNGSAGRAAYLAFLLGIMDIMVACLVKNRCHNRWNNTESQRIDKDNLNEGKTMMA